MVVPDWLRYYGGIHPGPCPHELKEQETFFNQLRIRHPRLHAIAIHPKNEGKRTKVQMDRQKAEGGFVKGASDIIIPGSPCFVCELKRRDRTKSKWESGQLDYLLACHDMGAFVCVAFGWEQAIAGVEEWSAK